MNQYDKLGTLLVLTAGLVIILQGIIDFIQAMRMVAWANRISDQSSSLSVASIIWSLAPIVIGALMVTLAKPIGRVLANGLE